jgi:hypothetical protein
MRAIVGIVACALVLVAPLRAAQTQTSSNSSVIRQVFGSYGWQAVRVASCESGLSVWARNGQYLGLFQMGSHERAVYGHGWDAWSQSRAAYRYFRDSGYDWSPWACKP